MKGICYMAGKTQWNNAVGRHKGDAEDGGADHVLEMATKNGSGQQNPGLQCRRRPADTNNKDKGTPRREQAGPDLCSSGGIQMSNN